MFTKRGINMERQKDIISVGVDLHTTQFTVCALVEGDLIIHEEVYPTTEEGYRSFIKWAHGAEEEYKYGVSIAIEATGNARYFRNMMEHEDFSVIVINTMKFKVIVASATKTDKRDAYTIAYFLGKDMLPESHLCDQDTEELRKLLSERSDLVSLMVKTKNKAHALLRGYGIQTTASQFQSKRSRQQLLKGLEDHPLYTKHAAATLTMLLNTLTTLSDEVKKYETLIDEFTLEDENVQLLKSIPGVGRITSASISAYVGDISRFETYKQFAAYCGLAPFVRLSNEGGYLGHITKNGPTELRTNMVQVVMGMLRVQSKLAGVSLINDYKKMKKLKGSGKSIIAFARKLSRIIYVMLKSKTRFDATKLMRGVYDAAS